MLQVLNKWPQKTRGWLEVDLRAELDDDDVVDVVIKAVAKAESRGATGSVSPYPPRHTSSSQNNQ